MPKVAILFLAAGLAAAASVSRAQAESRSVSCQTINGQTICLRSSAGTGVSLSCQTTNGDTTCVGSGGLRCASDARGRLVCHGGDRSTRVEIYRSPAYDAPNLDEDDSER